MVSKSADPLTRDRGFESGSLQRRVVQTFGSSYRRAKADRLDTAHAAPWGPKFESTIERMPQSTLKANRASRPCE